MKIAALFVAVVLLSGCTNLQKRIDGAVPDGSFKSFRATLNGKFSTTQLEATEFEKTADFVRAKHFKQRHSNAWVSNLEIEAEEYFRPRAKNEK